MKKIDLDTYPRRALFDAFISLDIPTYSITCQVDITSFRTIQATLDCGFFVPFSYLLSRAINAVPEFRHRLIDGDIYEFERIDPSYTVLQDDRTFSFCDSRHFDAFVEYRDHAQRQIQAAREHPVCDDKEKHNSFFITNLPWLNFTSITHPFNRKYASIPIISVGRFCLHGDRVLIPIGLQCHHALVDGIHIGDFFGRLGELCSDPADVLGLC
ncbi:MAG: hypothetical protein HGB00_07800 [Chlorobiaceae bacterium]|nr:hypothetical protein [Chlorobiaceae bacterium]